MSPCHCSLHRVGFSIDDENDDFPSFCQQEIWRISGAMTTQIDQSYLLAEGHEVAIFAQIPHGWEKILDFCTVESFYPTLLCVRKGGSGDSCENYAAREKDFGFSCV